MRAMVPWLLALALLPRVEDPWPDTIDLGFPFATAAAGCVLAGAMWFLAAEKERERAIKLGGFLGFSVGSVFTSSRCRLQVMFSL